MWLICSASCWSSREPDSEIHMGFPCGRERRKESGSGGVGGGTVTGVLPFSGVLSMVTLARAVARGEETGAQQLSLEWQWSGGEVRLSGPGRFLKLTIFPRGPLARDHLRSLSHTIYLGGCGVLFSVLGIELSTCLWEATPIRRRFRHAAFQVWFSAFHLCLKIPRDHFLLPCQLDCCGA